MAYVKNTWVDQNVQRPKTYQVTTNQDGSITLTDDFGLVTELGTPVNATNMNHIEQGIYDNDTHIGTLTSLTTTTKTDLVSAVNELDSDKAEKDLSNLTSTSSTNFDGQWVISWETLAENVNYTAGAVVTYSLSNYLPNDNYTYECLFCFYGRTGSTSGDIVSGSLYSGTGADVTTNLKAYVGRAQTRTASTVICSGSAILPIKPTDRAVTYSNEDGIGTSGGSGLKVAGYRRIGTNS